jgi:hypothetical protein
MDVPARLRFMHDRAGYPVSVAGRLTLGRRLATAAAWPFGVALTSWNYMWRTTPMHRREVAGSPLEDRPPPLPSRVSDEEVQRPEHGVGPLFHRRYRARIRDPRLSPEELVAHVSADPNRVAPTEFARFQKVRGDERLMQLGDEFVVRMPGPWDGPVRVVDLTATSFRFTTLSGHLEAGQIEFHAGQHNGELVFCIESWARSGDWLCNLLYDRLRMAKEIQLHMWISFLERVARVSGGRISGGIEIDTRRVDEADDAS